MIVCVLWWAYIQFWSNASEKEDVSAKREADWSFQKPKVPETKLTDQEECALCGSRKESMTGMFSGKDAIGIISVNDWYIMDLKIKSGNEKENRPEDTEGKKTTRTTVGKNGRVLERSSESLRGISEIVVDYGEDRVLSMEKASQILCQSCLEKLSEAMEVKCEEGKEPEPVDLVLIDFETMELYSVQEQYTKKSIRDYTLWMAHTGTLYVEGRILKLETVAILKADAYDKYVYRTDWKEKEEKEEPIRHMYELEVHTRGQRLTVEDQMIALSTCSSGNTNGRHLLICKVIKENTVEGSETE